MLQPVLGKLNSKRIILASGSPRRKGLLEQIVCVKSGKTQCTSISFHKRNAKRKFLQGLKFDIVTSNFEENLKKESFNSPLDYVKETAKQKVLEVTNRLYGEGSPPPDLIIGADTIVTQDNEIFEKPRSRSHAIEILSRFSGKSHTVYTAVVLVTPSTSGERFKLTEFQEGTEVFMGDLTKEVIEAYVDTGEPMDKAGGYGIQALGSTLITGVKGDYFNVIGFPLHPFAKEVLNLFSCS